MCRLSKYVLIIAILSIAFTVSGCNPESERDNSFYLLKHIKSNYVDEIKYKTDVPSDTWQTAKQTLYLKTGDCEDFAILYAAELMRSDVEYKDKLVFGYYKSKFTGIEHLVLIVDGYYIADNYGISKMTPFYRDEYELKNIFPIINSRTPLDYYNLP